MSEIIELSDDPNSLLEALLISLKTDNFEEFKTILELPLQNAININHVYADPENKTLLDIACSSVNKAVYVKFLLDKGANVNLLNQCYGAAPIHFAVSNSDFDTVKLLVEHGNTDIHQPNTVGLTAFHLAAQLGEKDFIRLLQKRQVEEIQQAKKDILVCPKTDKRTRRNDTKTADKSKQSQLAKSSESLARSESLFSLLRQRNYEAFASKANADNILRVDNDLKFTYLQYACKFGLIEFVELLLDLNVDPNETTELLKRTPITIAAFHGFYDIVQLLLDTGIIEYDLVLGENILHAIMHGFYLSETSRETHTKNKSFGPADLDDGDNRDHTKCLKLILNNVPDSQLNVDLLDRNGNTPLYYATVFDNRDMIYSLLERGAYIGAKNWNGEELIKFIRPATLEYFLDGGLTSYGHVVEKHYNIKFNYNLLTCRKENPSSMLVHETKLLIALSEVSELKPLLKHPFFLVFLDFKWHIIMNKLVYINLAFYIQFVVSLSYYLLLESDAASQSEKHILWFIIFTNNSIMFLREFTQLVIYSNANKYRYIKDPENWMEITLIVVIYVILYCKIKSIIHPAPLDAAAIFLSYVELTLLILSHPRASVHIKMFKAVALNSLEFLLSYLTLILAFAFSSYILLKNTNATDKFSKNILEAVYKTLVMSAGEYKLLDISIGDENTRFICHLLFLLFIFLIPIVLFNLLNAIAVSDIQGIRNNAELVSTVARAKMIAHMEDIISEIFSNLDKLATFYDALVRMFELRYTSRRPSGPKKYGFILEQSYYTNYFNTTGYCGPITYFVNHGHCTIHKHHGYGLMKFSILPTTIQTIREKVSAEASKVDTHDLTATVTEEAATLEEIYKNQTTLKNALERTEMKLAQIIELLNRKLK